MNDINDLLKKNKNWSSNKLKENPEIFKVTAQSQAPKYFWIGCVDSRVPPNVILDLEIGDVLVHRNIANLCPEGDVNSNSALEFAIDGLKIENIIVCGHYSCGGILAACSNNQYSTSIDSWLKNIQQVVKKYHEKLSLITDETKKHQMLVQLNVKEQILNISKNKVVQKAWANQQKLTLHAMVYDLKTGLLEDLNCSVSSQEDLTNHFG